MGAVVDLSSIVAASMKLVCSKFKIIEHLLQSLGESPETSFANLAKNEDFRKMIDSYFDEVLVTSLSQKMNQPIDEVEQQIKELSIDIQIVPEDILDIVDKNSLKNLLKEVKKTKWFKTFLDYEPLCKFHLNKLKSGRGGQSSELNCARNRSARCVCPVQIQIVTALN